MWICHSPIYSGFLFMILVLNSIERTVQRTSNDLDITTFDGSELGENAIRQHLRRIRENLRWIRSPKPKGRFYPWGGKRSSGASTNNLHFLCSSLGHQIGLSCGLKYGGADLKRDTFRPWGGKRTSPHNELQWNYFGESPNGNIFSPLDVYDGMNSPTNEYNTPINPLDYSNTYQYETDISQFKPVDVNSIKTNSPASLRVSDQPFQVISSEQITDAFPFSYISYLPQSLIEKKKLLSSLTPSSNERKEIKRQRFNPWGGKRSVEKRAIPSWSWKPSEKSINNIQEEPKYDETDRNKEHLEYTKEKLLQRKKRASDTLENLKMKNSTEESKISDENEVNGKNIRRTSYNIQHKPVKRSALISLLANTKRFGALTNLLKKFETLNEEPTQRGFHPWAGKKRLDITVSGKIPDNAKQNQTAEYFDGISKADPLINTINHLIKNKQIENSYSPQKMNIEYLTEKKNAFNPWAGKRTMKSRYLVLNHANTDLKENNNRADHKWLPKGKIIPEFPSKKAFNPWAGKRSVDK